MKKKGVRSKGNGRAGPRYCVLNARNREEKVSWL